MIIAEQKPIEEIRKFLKNHRKVLALGCDGCVAVCLAGGARETEILAAKLCLAGEQQVAACSIARQCDAEFFETVRATAVECDAILSLACGVGVQMAARVFPELPVYPALNTKFMGTNEAGGQWQENCLACGDCKLGLFGAVCPVTRCSKSLCNGPCGGSEEGMCEVDPERIQCGWHLIYERLKALGQLDLLLENAAPRDWSKTHSGGPRRLRRDDVAQDAEPGI